MSIKKNVDQYNRDVESEEGYGYTQDKYYSAYLVTSRINSLIGEYIQAHDDEIHFIIDIGCGDGISTNEIKKRFPDKQVAGFDPADKAIDIAHRKFPEIHFFVGDALEYRPDAKESRYDLAVLSSMLHHTSNPREVIRTVASYADRILIIEPNGNNPVRKILERTSKYYRDHEEVSFKPALVRYWCEEAGYTMNPVKHFNFIPVFFPAILARTIYCFTPVLEKIPVIQPYLSGTVMIYGSQ